MIISDILENLVLESEIIESKELVTKIDDLEIVVLLLKYKVLEDMDLILNIKV